MQINDLTIADAIARELPAEMASGRVTWSHEVQRVEAPWRDEGVWEYECGEVLVDGHYAGRWWDNRGCPLSPSKRPFPDVIISPFYPEAS